MKHKVAAALLAVVVLYPPHRRECARCSDLQNEAVARAAGCEDGRERRRFGFGDSDADQLQAVRHRHLRGFALAGDCGARSQEPEAGRSRPRLLDLKVSTGTSGTISGAFDLTAAQVQELAQGRYYVQLHSEKAPDGNLWGWLALQENRR